MIMGRKLRVLVGGMATSLVAFAAIRMLWPRRNRARPTPDQLTAPSEAQLPTHRSLIESVELISRIEASFRDVYLTLISIIQGVTFGFLAASAFADPLPNANQWIAYIICLTTIIVVWQEYMVGATAFIWTPTVLDAVVPFGIGIVEFLLIANARQSVGEFLTSFAIYLGAGVVGYTNWLFHARRGADLNIYISYPRLGGYVRFGTRVCIADFITSLGLIWVHAAVTWINDIVFLVTALCLMSPLLLHSIVNWNRTLHRIYLAIRHRDSP
jgi:hypothetical protein